MVRRASYRVAVDVGTDVALTATVVAGLLDASPDGTLLIDADGRMLLVNTAIEDLFGYDRGDLLGKPVEKLLPESARAKHEGHRREFAVSPRARPMGVGLVLFGRRRDGSEFPVEISLSPLVTNDGTWIVATVRDASERQAAQRHQQETALEQEQLRIAENLGDTVIRGLFGTGLRLQGLLEVAGDRVRPGLQQAIEEVDATIRDVREAIFGLRPDRRPDHDPE